jgi:hypothetical protein
VDQGLSAIEKAVDLGLLDIGWLDHCPLLQQLASSDRFQKMRERVAVRAREVLTVLSASPVR